jgi:hypothetical protein
MKKDITFSTSPDPKDDQIRVVLNPKDSHYSFDCVRLSLKQIDGQLQIVDMTPDEALEVASVLINSVQFFLLENKEYAKFIKREKKPNDKKTGHKWK